MWCTGMPYGSEDCIHKSVGCEGGGRGRVTGCLWCTGMPCGSEGYVRQE